MKIRALKTFLVPPRWLFLKIETDESLCGWGEPVLEGRAHTVATAVDEFSDYLIGKDPLPVEDHWSVLYRGGFYRGGGVHMTATTMAPTPALAATTRTSRWLGSIRGSAHRSELGVGLD
jgi:L-alanine-DL-glutamate epimerase-like enolase superfamily enzyme